MLKILFRLPKDKQLEKAWIARLKRADNLPKEVLICEDPFEPEWFDHASAELKQKLLAAGTQYQIKNCSSEKFPYY